MSAGNLSRREFFVVGGTATLAIGMASHLVSGADDQFEIIDCHTHLYGEDDMAYPPIEKPYRPPAGKGTIGHLRNELKAAGVCSVVDVQPMTFYGFDNRFTADLCRTNRDVLTGVCFLNPNDPQSPGLLEKYVKDDNIRGLRITANRVSGKLDEPGNDALLAVSQRLGITVCALVGREAAAELETLARRYPQLPIVIDHCFSLAAGKQHDATLEAIFAMAKLPNLYAKLSFIVSGSAEDYPCRDLHDSCRRIIAAYGAERCIWGSDFPCELWCPKATYAQHLRLFTHELKLDEKTKQQILAETPRRLGFGVEKTR